MRDLTLNKTRLKRTIGALIPKPAALLLVSLVIFLCCCSIEVRAQATVFGPERYTRSSGAPVAVNKTFTVSKPSGSFLIAVESLAPERDIRPQIKAAVQLNGRDVLGSDDSSKFRVVKAVALALNNTISVQLNGQPGSTIVITITPAPIYTLYTNPQEPLLLSAKTAEGKTIEYFGEKSANGHAKALNSILVTSANGKKSEYVFDNESRLAEIRSFNGLRIQFNWMSDSSADVTVTNADGSNQFTTPIDFAKLAREAGTNKTECKSCRESYSYARVGPERNHATNQLISPLKDSEIFSTTASMNIPAPLPVGFETACKATAGAIASVCDKLQAIEFGGITSQMLCASLASAAAATVAGLPLVPYIWGGCEVVMEAAEVVCIAKDVNDIFNLTDCTRIANFFTGIKNYIATKNIFVSASLQFSSSGTYSIGQTMNGTFSIVNRAPFSILLPKVLIGGRVGGTCPNDKCPDFTIRTNVTLSPGQPFNYSGTFTIPSDGNYTFSVAIQKPDGNWVIPVPPERATINQRSITVPKIAAKAVVSRSLMLAQVGPYRTGQALNGTFTVANRGTSSLVMKRVLIGGRVDGTCPNSQCPDFSPVPSSITLAPNQTYSYSGSFTPSRAGSYTFSVAYEDSDGKWVIPVQSENSSKNQLTISVTSLQASVVVSRSLSVTPNNGTLPLGQTVNGSFSVTNRGNASVTMRQVLIGGRVGDTCPNNVCPDFSPISPNITLNPGQTYNYSGQIKLSQPGTYTFYVAYQTPDLKWEMPVRPENGAINKLSVFVQGPTPTLTRAAPSSIAASPNAQTITIYGTRLAKVIYGELRLPNGTRQYLYIPLNQLFKVTDDQTRITTKFPYRGTYYVTVWTLEGKSNQFPIVVF